MTTPLIDDLMRQLQGAPTGQIAQQLGTDPSTASTAIAAALPMILGAMGRNTQSEGGAEALFSALQRYHSGAGAGGLDLGCLLGSVLGGGAPASRQMDAGGILGNIFGSAQPRAESGLGQVAGMSSSQAGNLLKILAPIVMAYLAKQVSTRGMDAGALGGMLGQQHAEVQQQGGLGGGLMNAVLDTDGDGKVDLSDLIRLGGGLLSGRR